MIGSQSVDQIAGYQILSTLGHGASSTIYAVMDPRDQHVYAVKRVTRRTASDERFIDQALNEHEVGRQVEHPVIRRSYKIIRRRKMLKTAELLMLMELVDGATLEQHRPTSAPKAIEVFKQAAEGLQALHETGFVHCDIKPNNIIVDDAGHVKIIDLGQSCPINTIKTRIQGTPDYIAPEQVLRQTITARTDVFNLGATMYWCLTNRHVPTMIPRTAGEQIGRLERAEFQPPIDIKPGIPKALNALVVSCLETEPASRPTSMREVRDRLNIVLRQLSRGANDQPHRLAR